MALDLAKSLKDTIVERTWETMRTTPEGERHSLYGTLVPTRYRLDEIFTSIFPTFSPDLLQILQGTNPPAISFFKGLPENDKSVKSWGVYVLILEKAGSRPCLYIGSGTKTQYGITNRLRNYELGSSIPWSVSRVLDNAYTITHKKIICSVPIDTIRDALHGRLIILALEAMFTFTFWAVNFRKVDKVYKMEVYPDWIASHSHRMDYAATTPFMNPLLVPTRHSRLNSIKSALVTLRKRYGTGRLQDRRKHTRNRGRIPSLSASPVKRAGSSTRDARRILHTSRHKEDTTRPVRKQRESGSVKNGPTTPSFGSGRCNK
ncbi:hypothetical protein VTI74DRAFT_8253 [Chaetomium olivicolor]